MPKLKNSNVTFKVIFKTWSLSNSVTRQVPLQRAKLGGNAKIQMWHRVISKTWSFRSSSVTRQVIIKRTNIGGTCQNSNATFCVIFKQCEGLSFLSSIFYGFWFLTVFHQIFLLRLRKLHIFFLASLLSEWVSSFAFPTSKAMPSLAEKKSLWKKKAIISRSMEKMDQKKARRRKKLTKGWVIDCLETCHLPISAL